METAITALIEAIEALINRDKKQAKEAIARAKIAVAEIEVKEDEGAWDDDLKDRLKRG